MKVGIPREVHRGERRVAATPETTARLTKLGFEVLVERGAGEGASFRDADYEKVGARLVPAATALWGESDIVLKVQPPEMHPERGGPRSRAAARGRRPSSASSGPPRTAS